MDCWETLGIAPRSDKKTIKIAYAKRLKLTRPDEDPEGFQALHGAYKEALSWEDSYYYDEDDEWVSTDVVDQPVQVSEPVYQAPTPSTQALDASEDQDKALDYEKSEVQSTIGATEPATVDQEPKTEVVESTLHSEVYTFDEPAVETKPEPELSAEDLALLNEIREQEETLGDSWEAFREKVNALVKDHKACNQVESWKFLETMPAMSDIEFRKSAGDSLFEVVAELNEESLEQKSLYIKRPVINYLNGLYGWDRHWQEYEYRYSNEMREAVFPYLEEAEKPVKGTKVKRELYYYQRMAAFAIDIAIFAAVTFVLYNILNLLIDEDIAILGVMLWAVIYNYILIPMQECSTHQATVGKRIMKLQVVNRSGLRLSFFHAFLRAVVTSICCSIFKVVIWINLILGWLRGELLQDSLTRSYVVKKLN
ncbi:hypothetical protein EOL70_02525 [Leucothrix sargassi]|nr:hypothetical protein EOL70_02525 [Leucothrix sargassi]